MWACNKSQSPPGQEVNTTSSLSQVACHYQTSHNHRAEKEKMKFGFLIIKSLVSTGFKVSAPRSAAVLRMAEDLNPTVPYNNKT